MEDRTDQEIQGLPELLQPGYSDAPRPSHQALFQGDAGEYFRIWIVNMLLSLLTLGIYSPWATVRNRRYLYGSTELDGDRFDFHGNPVAILKGRILAVAFFAAYAFGGDFYYLIPVIAFLVLLILFPWIMVKAMRFRLTNTSWRNLRFGFKATVRDAYMTLALPVIVSLLAYGFFFWTLIDAEQVAENGTPNMGLLGLSLLGLVLVSFWLVPLINQRIRNLAMNNIHYGDEPFHADIQVWGFFTAYMKMLGMSIVASIAGMIIVAGITLAASPVMSFNDPSSMAVFIAVVTYIVMVLVYLLPFAVWQVKTSNYVISATRVRQVSFHMAMEVGAYWWLLLSNALAAVLTIGLAIPWAKIRMIRYKLSRLTLEGDVNSFSGSHRVDQSATGDEIGEAFDIDFGF